jgi:hypothetical protein
VTAAVAKLRWTANRLSRMSLAEVAFRVQRALSERVERAGFGLATSPPRAADRHVGPWLPRERGAIEAAPAVATADRILAGRFRIFARDYALGFPPQWNVDPATGVRAPLDFGKRIDYRDERRVGNIKTLWEPSRHLELVSLAQAFALTAEPRYAEGCATLLRSWFEQCPYPRGVHWASSLEAAIRLLNWSVAWDLLGGADAPLPRDVREAWLASVYQHCWFIDGHRSRHSSANNHLLGEWMGLFVAALTWPCWPRSARWLRRARDGFEAEALAQNAPDGVNREQAVYYHHEVADMMLLCGLAGRARGVAFAPAYWQRLQAMLDFVLALMDVRGHVPMIGDADDALMLRLHHDDDAFCPYRSLLASGAVLFGRADFKAAAGAFDAKSRWLLGADGACAFDALPVAAPAPRVRHFEHGGYTVLGTRLGEADELRLVADAGPLGYLSIAAHGHADALAFTLSAGGHELLVDPGTYAYHTEREWRDWFRGTAAHNTVEVDGENQSVIGGNFMWLQRAQATLETLAFGEQGDVWQASHDGYRRLADPVLHRRRIEVAHAQRTIVVTDTLECEGSHTARLHWHVAETVDVRLDGCDVVLDAPGVRLRVTLLGATVSPTLLRGGTDPRGGWLSRRFGKKQPTTQIVWTLPVHRTTQWRTELRVETTS